MKFLLAIVLVTGCATTQTLPPAKASAATSGALYDEIAGVDRAMFDAFNAHDIDTLMRYFDPHLEFFHDTGGLLTYADARTGMKSNFDKNNGIRRDLVPGSLEVYPIRDYGAIEVGAHRFCHVENGANDCGTFKFVHV